MAQEVLTQERGSLSAAGKYLTFRLAAESYGIDILKVREIIRHVNITPVPEMPDYIRGVINLRGKIIPVMDLRRRFKIPQASDTELTCIVVVQLGPQSSTQGTAMGMVVDGVEEVVNINAGEIEQAPSFGGENAADYIVGMAKVKGAVKVLLDIDRAVGTIRLEEQAIPTV
jgi:purine-binding chemotaxis protein CheW